MERARVVAQHYVDDGEDETKENGHSSTDETQQNVFVKQCVAPRPQLGARRPRARRHGRGGTRLRDTTRWRLAVTVVVVMMASGRCGRGGLRRAASVSWWMRLAGRQNREIQIELRSV